jgi:hypothetical protein
VPAPGATCTNPITIGGSGSGSGDAGEQGAGEAGPDAAGCSASAVVDQLLGAMSGCLPCVKATPDCCAADQACSAACAYLAQCAQQCGDQVCVTNGCEMTWATGLRQYRALANCVSQNCGTQCPLLQQ